MSARLVLEGGPEDGLELDFSGYEWPPPEEIEISEAHHVYRLYFVDPVPADLAAHHGILVTARYQHQPQGATP